MSETQQQKCADLARATGIPESEWPFKCLAEHHLNDEDAWCYDCCETITERIPPNPYESADDSRALVAWLAKQERHIQQRFVFAVRDETTDVDLCYELRIMTTPLSVIADAAWLSIQEKQ